MGNKPGYVKSSISQSFVEEEIELLNQLVSTLLRGGDASTLVRHSSFRSLCRKTKSMKARAVEVRQQRLSSTEVGEVK